MTTELRRSDINRDMTQNTPKSNMIPIWDAWTRLFHWSFAGAVLFLLLSGSTGFLFFDAHRLVGELVIALIIFRIVWGMVGSSNVRLLRLAQHPRLAISHLASLFKRDVDDSREHNAAGGWAVVIMLLLLSTQALTGMFIADEDEFIEGAFYGVLSSEQSDWLYRIHHWNAELIIAVVAIHVVMILVYWLYAGKNLILPMITGRMRWTSGRAPQDVFFQRFWVGLVCVLLIALVLGYTLQWDRQLF